MAGMLCYSPETRNMFIRRTSKTGVRENSMGKVKVIRIPSGREKTIDFEGEKIRVDSLLKLMGLKRESVLVVKREKLLPEESYVEDGDELTIYDVVSGG